VNISEVAIEDKLHEFIKEHGEEQCYLELLRFFGRHPYTRFSRRAIVRALDHPRFYVERDLGRLINSGVVKAYTSNSVSFYSLTDDESLCSLVLDLAKLNWLQWRLVLRQIYSAPVE